MQDARVRRPPVWIMSGTAGGACTCLVDGVRPGHCLLAHHQRLHQGVHLCLGGRLQRAATTEPWQ